MPTLEELLQKPNQELSENRVIVVINDIQDTLDSLVMLLNILGFEAYAAPSIEAAMDLFGELADKGKKVFCVMVDQNLGMGRMTGDTLYNEGRRGLVKNLSSDTIIELYTGSQADDPDRAIFSNTSDAQSAENLERRMRSYLIASILSEHTQAKPKDLLKIMKEVENVELPDMHGQKLRELEIQSGRISPNFPPKPGQSEKDQIAFAEVMAKPPTDFRSPHALAYTESDEEYVRELQERANWRSTVQRLRKGQAQKAAKTEGEPPLRK